MDIRVAVEGVAKTFPGGAPVLRDVNLDLRDGEVLVLLGRNGCGKSVLFKVIDALLQPDRGTVRVDGENILNKKGPDLDRLRMKFGFVFQKSGLFDSLTVGENVAFGLNRYTNKSQREIEEIVATKLSQVGMKGAETKFPAELSGGMQKRVGLARAIALNPEIVLYDDPTAGLDPILTDAIGSLILKMKGEFGITSLVITHDLKLMDKIADRVCLLYRGEILGLAPLREFRESEDPVIRQYLEGSLDGPIDLLE